MKTRPILELQDLKTITSFYNVDGAEQYLSISFHCHGRSLACAYEICAYHRTRRSRASLA